jgi:outer membrane murein-binding lipoprotein Lpp
MANNIADRRDAAQVQVTTFAGRDIAELRGREDVLCRVGVAFKSVRCSQPTPQRRPGSPNASALDKHLRQCFHACGAWEDFILKMKMLAALIGATALSGCATRADNITASYVSPVLYQNLTCQQLALEATNVSSRAQTAAGMQNKKAGQDAAAMTVGLVLFWPALLFTQGDGAPAAEVARLKGEMQAIEDASTRKGCGIVFQKEPPKKPTKGKHPADA